MHNATHAISPILALARHQAHFVQCVGSGRIYQRMAHAQDSPFAVESTTSGLLDSDLFAEVTRSLWTVARGYRESFDVYGSIRSFEWEQVPGYGHVVFTGESPERPEMPDYAARLPQAIRHFTRGGVYTDEGDSAHLSFIQGGGHGGSHPHLADRLVRAVQGEVDPFPNAVQAANITCAGICSHQSAKAGGERVFLPEWTLSDLGHQAFIDLDQTTEPPWAGQAGLVPQREGSTP
jgi:hypothetical protein